MFVESMCVPRLRNFFFLLLIALFTKCTTPSERKVERGFYYWRTVYDLSAFEKEAIDKLSVKHLYIKFFDVEWEASIGEAMPVAKVIFKKDLPKVVNVIPVIYITQEVLQQADSSALQQLAHNINGLLKDIVTNNKISLLGEIQIDCDWTPTTKARYFFLLQQMKQTSFFKEKIISATIRLHQLKFVSENGVPPVDKGLLMCYNMGNLRIPKTKKSIIDAGVLQQYINNLENYPLHTDIALPIFEWWVLFHKDQYKGLLRDFDPGKQQDNKKQIRFEKDTVINGMTLGKDHWLRHETSDALEIQRCAAVISKKLRSTKQLSVILFHLDQRQLSNYTLHELETFYNSLR